MIASSPDVFGEFFYFVWSVLATQSDSDDSSSAKKTVIKERRRKKVFSVPLDHRLCFHGLHRRLASEASVMTSLRRAQGSEKEEGKKWNVSVWTNQRASEKVVGGTLCSHVSGACSTNVM